MNLIAAADENWAIGKGGGLLASIPADMKFFREMTMGKVVVMGRKTLESLPNGKPLKNRTNIVLTKKRDYRAEDAIVVHTKEELFEQLKQYDGTDVFVIGGGSIYRLLLSECDRAYITKIIYAYEADTYIPNLDESPDWELVKESEEQTYFDLEYYFLEYRRKGRGV